MRSAFLPRLTWAVVIAGIAFPSVGRAQQSSMGKAGASSATLEVMAAIVLPDMTVRPVPLHQLEVVSTADTTVRVAVRTGLDGNLQQQMPAGAFRLRSVRPAVLNDSSFHWDVPVQVTASGARVELTNANATVSAVQIQQTGRQIAPERVVYEQARRGVFRVEAGLGHGSGFLIENPHGTDALVVTNDHVVARSSAASVYLDSLTRVEAQVVARDREADLAILRVATPLCAGCPRLKLASAAAGGELVLAGERVLAIGFPLNQEMTLTSGIVSSVRDGAIISDVNINHGNSGGPMLNLAGEVVGVNTFGDFTNQGGPGISGAIAITRLGPLLAKVPEAIALLPAPAERLLPTMPRTVYPLAVLRAHADTINPKGYRKLFERGAGKFIVNITTPVMYRVAQRIAEAEVGGERKQRERRANVAADEQYSEANQSRDWEQYVGNGNTPVVTIAIIPKVGETGGSLFTRALVAGMAGVAIQAKYKFQGDVRGARFYRNGVEIEPIRGGHGPQTVMVENQWVQLKDVADMGYYVLPPEAFAPDSTGAPAVVTIVVVDLKNPNNLSATQIDGAPSARIWNDFAPYFVATRPEGPWVHADARKKSPRIALDCEPQQGACTVK